jgi:hypothetical protein
MIRVLGVLFLGALANGLWQYFLGPTIHLITRWILDVASLGVSSYKNGVYEQIATDNQSAVTVHTLTLVTFTFALILALNHVRQYGKVTAGLSKTERLIAEMSDAPSADPPVTLETLKQRLVTSHSTGKRLRTAVIVNSLGSLIVVGSLVISVARLAYVSSAVSHYRQTLRVASPYFEPHQQAEVESDFPDKQPRRLCPANFKARRPVQISRQSRPQIRPVVA